VANNRMYLLHKPTGFAVQLANRMGGSYTTRLGAVDLENALNDLFDEAAEGDEFALCFEIDDDNPHAVRIIDLEHFGSGNLKTIGWAEKQTVASDRQALDVGQLTDKDLEAIGKAKVPDDEAIND